MGRGMDRLTGVPTFTDFAAILDAGLFRPLPDDWVIGLSDVVSSTEVIAAGRYKAVNIAGAAAISAMMNALRTRHFAFLFGGDGSTFVLPPGDRALAERVLAETAAWVRDDLRLTLRTAVVTVGEVRACGHDVRVALFAPSEHVSYAMFDGGGVAFAEAEMKAGRYAITPAGPGARPDLSGLSCRWRPLRARRGEMVSIIVRPASAGIAAFRTTVRGLLQLLGEAEEGMAPSDLRVSLGSPAATRLEALASRGTRRSWRQMMRVWMHTLFGWALFATHLRLGGFDPDTYRAVTAQNADARKFGDGLLLTVDCDADLSARVRASLEAAAARGEVRFGMVAQDAALITCIVPSYQDHGHYHFLDGAGGGYAAAAKAIK